MNEKMQNTLMGIMYHFLYQIYISGANALLRKFSM